MKNRWRHLLTGLAFASCIAMLAPACVVRARGHVRTRGVVVVDDTNPPPAPRYVTPARRAGYVWARGHWEFRGGKWVWMAGHWERARGGNHWVPGHWEKRGARYHWIAGRWQAGGGAAPAGGGVVVRDHRAPRGPMIAPPARRAENPGARAGYVWVTGRWNWKGNKWVWMAGHWERARTGYRWAPGRWQLRGGVYVWVEGSWQAAPAGGGGGGVVVRDHRAPKPLPYPTSAPPARRAENHAARAGYVWATGRWNWKGGKWMWMPGHWERARAGRKWTAGRWERRGNRYVWVAGRWEAGVQVRDHRKPKPDEPNPRKNTKVKAHRAPGH